MTFGAVVFLATDPTADMMAATKHYVDINSPVGNYLPLSGGVLTGALAIQSTLYPTLTMTGLAGIGAYTPTITLDIEATAAAAGIIQTKRHGYLRWMMTLGDGFAPESGNAVGTDFILSRYDDIGHLLGNVLTIARGTGNTNLNAGLTVSGAVILQAGDPTTDQQAATKHYVDTKAGAFLPLVGGNLTGPLSINWTGYTWQPFPTDQQLLTLTLTGGPGGSAGTFIISAGSAEPAVTGIAAQGSMSSPVQPLYTQSLMRIAGRAFDGVGWSSDQAAIMLKTNEQWNQTSHGTFILFMVTPKGSVTRNPSMVLNGSGNLLLGTNDPGTDNARDRLQVNGSGSFTGPIYLNGDPSAPAQAATKNYVDTKVGNYVAKIGDTMSGQLTIDSTTAASLHITGRSGAWPVLIFDSEAAGTSTGYIAAQRFGLNRWTWGMGDGTAESGGNVGTDFSIDHWADDGTTYLGHAIKIIRQTGEFQFFNAVTLAQDPTAPLQAVTLQYLTGKIGNYLPIAGGIMQGGIVWADVYGQNTTDATHHLILHSGFGLGITANRFNHIAGAAGSHVFINGTDTVAISSTGIAMQGATDITLSRVPTGNMMAVPKQYADLMLPLAGGTMTTPGGIAFTSDSAHFGSGPADLSHHIKLYTGYGFSITSNRLNIVTGAQTWFTNSATGVDVAYFDAAGLHIVGTTPTVTLVRDPTQPLEAATMQYADKIIVKAGGPFLPISAGVSNALTGMLYLPTTTPTINEQATNKLYVDTKDQALANQIAALAQNLVFVGQIHVPEDSTLFTAASGITPSPGPMPPATAATKGWYVIVVEAGSPPVHSNIPPGNYVLSDWIVSDGQEWVWLQLGLVYFTAAQVATIPAIQGTINVQDTLAWLNTNKLNLAGGTMQGPLLLASDPSSNLMAATRQYVDGKAFLPIAGGVMQGGISFGTLVGVSNSDTSKHITLYTSGYGFGITSSRLNYNASSAASHVFLAAGVDLLSISSVGLTMVGSTDIYLPRLPTAGTQAANKNYVDSRTPIFTDAPNDTQWYARHSGIWAHVPGLLTIGGGAYDLNAVSPADFQGIVSITNQTSAPNWPSDNPDQTGAILHTWNSNAAWRGQLMMGGRQHGPQPALWYRSNDDAGGTGAWSPWNRLIGSTGGTFNATVWFSAPQGTVPVYIYANGNGVVPAMNWNGALSFNLSAGLSEFDFVNCYNTPSRSFSWWQVNTATAMSQLMWLSPNGDLTVSGNVYLPQDPSAPLQAATRQYVDALRTLVTGSYLPIAGGVMSGGISFGARTVVSNSDTSQHITLWNPGHGIGVTPARVNYNVGSGSAHVFLVNAFDIATINGAGITINSGTVTLIRDPQLGAPGALEAATRQYVDNRFGSGVTSFNTRTGPVTLTSADVTNALTYTPVNRAGDTMTGTLQLALTSTATTAPLYVRPGGGALSQEGKQRFGGTFASGTDFGVRLTASLRSGFASGAWGGEYLDVWLNNGAVNDVASDVNQVQVARFNRFGITMPANMAITLAADPSTNLQAATRQYVDGVITRAGGPFLPIVGGEITGQLQVDGPLYAIANTSVITSGTFGTVIVNNLTQGAGETDFVNLYVANGGFNWYQMQAGFVKSLLARLRPTGILDLYGLGITYPGVLHGGNVIGFAWFNNAIETYVDGNDVGALAFQAAIPLASTTTPLMDAVAAVGTGTTWARADHVHPVDTSRYAASNPSGYQTAAQVTASLAPYALLASPVFTGDPQAPTAATADADNSIATTAFVKNQGYQTAAQVTASLAPYAPLASPVFTGNPQAPTPATADSSASIATTAFVKNQGYATTASLASGYLPLAGGTLTGGLTSPWYHVSSFTAAYSAQGAYIMWNRAGGGICNFVNNRGLGSGGFNFIDSNSSLADVLLLTLTTSIATLNTPLTASGIIQAGVSTAGTVQLNPGTSTNTGYVAFFNAAGARQGYLGFASGSGMNLTMEGSTTTLNLSGALTVSSLLTANGLLNVPGNGIQYSFSGNRFGFGWDGSFIVGHVDGSNYSAQLATVPWVNSNFKAIGAYTPNQNVDLSSGPTFGNVSFNGAYGITFTGVYNSGVWYAFGWDGSCLNYAINGGGQGQLYTVGQSDGRYLLKGGDTCTGNLVVNGFINTQNYIMNASGVFYVANNTGYYLARSSGDGAWRFVENGTINFTLDTAGSLTARGSINCNGGLSCAGQSMWFGNGASGRVMNIASNWYWDWNSSTGQHDWIANGSSLWMMRASDWLCSNNNGWINAVGYTTNSDIRGKQGVSPATIGLKEIMQIEPIYFTRIPYPVPDDATMPDGSPMRQVIHPAEIGFSAQQVRPIIPEAVHVIGIALHGSATRHV